MKKLFLVLFALLLITGTASSQKKQNSESFTFIQVTDPQFGFFEANKGFGKETELYERAINAINKLAPDFVVVTGDLINNKDDQSQKAEFKRLTARINPRIPVYYTPGNHDIGNSPTAKDINSFISDYGYDKFSFKHKKCVFIGLNSCLIKTNTPELEQVQFDWLKKELLKSRKAKHIVVFSHHPFFVKAFDEPEQYFNIRPETRTRYISLFTENHVDAVFAGHLHNNAFAKYKNLQMVTTSAVGKPLGDVPSGFRIVKVFPDRVESTYYGLDEIPEVTSAE